ncbi:N-acetylglucosaminyl transferase [Streptococcus pneumoniae GA06083]|nr:degenerate transposase [imported] - Streptococcus pneumoniae (strain R6) [Streptococcus pneumoniae]AAK99416.1 Degenerate transposase [Streptococcus pneumoniae R6]ACB89904.1 hypothetical protein SPCG_0652 [Streptococcus pneumoniae CGSP14]EDK72090.1 Degenerate transposase [Streptococcus pneumoniae SP19-BS75]EFL65308.1 hypothetical protein CGSSpBS455_04633 [Streptococcus pneumoniae BS455]EFL67991.1 hypothetical protein CGSSp14BS292_08535 [Streptococcus pneumoniae SP14-BS292]EFL69345.1 hypothe
MGILFYFADAYSSWQRGSNENANGLLREYFLKPIWQQLPKKSLMVLC